MTELRKAITFDVGPNSLGRLREALPGWEIETTDGATTHSLTQDWSPGEADLLVVGARDQAVETLGMCRGLRSQVGRAHTPLLVLVRPAQHALVPAALEAGASSCLVVPVDTKNLANRVARAWEVNQPGRHTLGLDHAQAEDPWQDDGGEA
jgi:DNA-binding response OmpR family regulator